MIRIFEALPTQTRGREFATTELPADAHAIAEAMSAKYPEFVYTIAGEWNGEQFTIRYQDGRKLPPLTEEEYEPVHSAHAARHGHPGEPCRDRLACYPGDRSTPYHGGGFVVS